MDLTKLIAHVIRLYTIDAATIIAFHPGDNVMASMIAMTCPTKTVVQAALPLINSDAEKVENAFYETKLFVIKGLIAVTDQMSLDVLTGEKGTNDTLKNCNYKYL